MVSMHDWSVVDGGSEPPSDQTKHYIKLVLPASPLSMQH